MKYAHPYVIVKHWQTEDGKQYKAVVAQGTSLKTALQGRAAMVATDFGGAGIQWVAYGVGSTGDMK